MGLLLDKELLKKVTEPIENAPNEVRRIIEKVLQLEYAKLSQSRPHMVDDIVSIIKEEIKA